MGAALSECVQNPQTYFMGRPKSLEQLTEEEQFNITEATVELRANQNVLRLNAEKTLKEIKKGMRKGEITKKNDAIFTTLKNIKAQQEMMRTTISEMESLHTTLLVGGNINTIAKTLTNACVILERHNSKNHVSALQKVLQRYAKQRMVAAQKMEQINDAIKDANEMVAGEDDEDGDSESNTLFDQIHDEMADETTSGMVDVPTHNARFEYADTEMVEQKSMSHEVLISAATRYSDSTSTAAEEDGVDTGVGLGAAPDTERMDDQDDDHKDDEKHRSTHTRGSSSKHKNKSSRFRGDSDSKR